MRLQVDRRIREDANLGRPELSYNGDPSFQRFAKEMQEEMAAAVGPIRECLPHTTTKIGGFQPV